MLTSANNNTQERPEIVYTVDEAEMGAEALRAGTWVHVVTEGDKRWWLLHKNHTQAYINSLPKSYSPIARILQALLDTGIKPTPPCFVEDCWFGVTKVCEFGDEQAFYPPEEELAIELVRAMSIELEESWFAVTLTHPTVWYLACRQ